MAVHRSSVETIGEHAFSDCVKLHQVRLPASVTLVSAGTFKKCIRLKTANLSTSVTSIGNSAFAQCASMKTMDIPASVISIGNNAFEQCTSMKTMVIPTSVISIGNNAFAQCTSMKTMDIPASVSVIKKGTFRECGSLVRVGIPTSVTAIEDAAFDGCSSAKLTVPPSATVASTAFLGCKSVDLGGREGAFELVHGMHVIFPAGTTEINSEWNVVNGIDPRSVRRVTFPDSVTVIGANSFLGFVRLKSVQIPRSVQHIGESAFERCTSLATLEIPSTTHVQRLAFTNSDNQLDSMEGCPALTMVLVQPAEDGDEDHSDGCGVGAMFDPTDDGSDDEFLCGHCADSGCSQCADQRCEPLRHVQCIWAVDSIIKRFEGQLAPFDRFADLPPDSKAAPQALTWAAVQLWHWWSPPNRAGHADTRIVCKSRDEALYATVMSGYRAEKLQLLPPLPEELWICIFGFLEHDDAPYYDAI